MNTYLKSSKNRPKNDKKSPKVQKSIELQRIKFLRKRLGFDIVDRIHEFFDFFGELYAQHERTFDPAQLRDFIDVYCSERRRVSAKDLKESSFYGEEGNLNYVNTMFDLFLVRDCIYLLIKSVCNN